MKNVILATILFAFFSCERTSEIEPNQEFSIKENSEKVIVYNEQDVSIKISEVRDSRCPEDAVCIRAGEAIVVFDFKVDGLTYPSNEICLGCEQPFNIPQELNIAPDITIELKKVSPFPTTKNGSDKKNITFKFI